jgi:hypothetical protein
MIRWADVILVLERGRLVATGNHDRLLRTSPVYRRVFARYDIDLPPLERPEPEEPSATLAAKAAAGLDDAKTETRSS